MTQNRQPSTLSKSNVLTLRFGGKLDLFLLERDLTNEGFAGLTGIPLKTIERIRAGRSAPSAAHFVRILQALKLWTVKSVRAEDLEGGSL